MLLLPHVCPEEGREFDSGKRTVAAAGFQNQNSCMNSYRCFFITKGHFTRSE